METSIDARDRDVQSAFEKAHAIARGATTTSLDHIETSLWTALLALGRAMIGLYLARVAARPRSIDYVHNGSKFVLVGSATDEIGTRFGKGLDLNNVIISVGKLLNQSCNSDGEARWHG